MSNYLVTLTPIDKFFFGADMMFSVKGQDERYSSYIIESLMFPQQTSLLGMLRFLLLKNAADLFDGSNIRHDKKDDVEKLIGPTSFSVKNAGKETNDFGKIKRLHRCFVRCETSDGQIHNLDFLGFDSQYSSGNALDIKCCINGREVSLPNLKDYSAKTEYKRVLSDGSMKLNLEDVFIEDRRIGIQRDIYTGETSDSGLFKQISYRFNNKDCKYSFAFYLEADLDNLDKYSGQVVSVGADSSQFVIAVTPAKISDIPDVEDADECKLILKSPAYIDADTVSMADWMFTDTIPFRFLETSVRMTDNYSVLSRKHDGKELVAPKRSTKYELYAGGSVFHFESSEIKKDFIAKLASYEGFRQIGYNEF